MTNTPAATWIRLGLFALPVYALLTMWSTIGAQPNAAVDPEGWARYVSDPSYLAIHVLGRTGGAILGGWPGAPPGAGPRPLGLQLPSRSPATSRACVSAACVQEGQHRSHPAVRLLLGGQTQL